jgi:hypothetical protein
MGLREGRCDKPSYGRKVTSLPGTTGLQIQLKQTVGLNVPIQEQGQGREILRLQPCTEPLPVNRALNPDYHAERRHCNTTFLIAYEGLSHLPSRSPS